MTPIVGLMPMRRGSERVAGKNTRPLCGRPLFHHALSALVDCPPIGHVVVDTDCPDVAAGVRQHFPAVQLIERPAELRGGDVPMNEVLVHDARLVEAELYLQTHATNPLLRSATLAAAIERFQTRAGGHDCLLSVTPVRKRFWTAAGEPLNHDPSVLLRTQDLPPLLEENSCIYIFPRRLILETGSRVGASPLTFEMDPIEAWDIDDESDFAIAEALYQVHRAC